MQNDGVLIRNEVGSGQGSRTPIPVVNLTSIWLPPQFQCSIGQQPAELHFDPVEHGRYPEHLWSIFRAVIMRAKAFVPLPSS
jgi:hypothetical protein